MQLQNSFTINRPIQEVYEAFLQVERIATCMPGSTLLGQPSEDTYEGEVKVKVGPLAMTYAGQFVVLDTDDAQHRLRMRAKGREKRGGGNADAYIVAALSESGPGTTVRIDTELDIRGKVAQFGRGVIGEVTDGIMQTFARNLEEMLRSGGLTSTAAAGPSSGVSTAGAAASGSSTSVGAASPAADPAGAELDAWKLIIRPMLQRHSGAIVTVAASAVAAWLGGRAGARSGRRSP